MSTALGTTAYTSDPTRLDAAPSSDMPRPAQPGDDTKSLLGGMNPDAEGAGMALSSPTGRAIAGVAMILKGINLIETVVPGAVPPEFIQIADMLRQSVPQAVQDLQSSGGLGMLGMAGTFGGSVPQMGGSGAGMPQGMQSGMGLSQLQFQPDPSSQGVAAPSPGGFPSR